MTAPAAKPSTLRSLAREPLVHFPLIGCVLAALDRLGGGVETDPNVMVIDEGVRRALSDAYEHEHGAPPDEVALDALVEQWIDDEVLYREGLDREGVRVRQRVAALMRALVEAERPAPVPTAARCA